MRAQDFVSEQMGRAWILSDLKRHGPSTFKPGWRNSHLRQLLERGLIRKSTRILHGWEVTAKGREAIEQ